MQTQLYGWTGKILHVDLTSGSLTTQYLAHSVYQTKIGGRGLAGHFLRPFYTSNAKQAGPPLLFFTGPLTGSNVPGTQNGTLMSHSPLTNTVCDCQVHGKFPVLLKRAGWDGFIITGHADAPCGLEIDNNSAFLTKSDLWGQTTDVVLSRLAANETSIATIGPAAENGAQIASVIFDNDEMAGHGGLGHVWAQKKLKYIRVKGNGEIRIYDEERLADAREKVLRLIAASPVLQGENGIFKWGTTAFVDLMDARRMMPTHNFRHTHFPHAQKLNASAFHSRYAPRPQQIDQSGMPSCHKTQDGRILPNYDSINHFSALIGNHDIEIVMQANTICAQLGLDPISAGATLACVQEIFKDRISSDSILQNLELMAQGNELGCGSLAFAQSLNRVESAMMVKGMAIPAYDPRGAYGLALAYAISTRGACHLRASPLTHEIFRKPVATDRFTLSGKARILKIAEDQNAAINSLGVTQLLFMAVSLEEYAQVYNAVTGHEITAQTLCERGEHIYYNERIMNALQGIHKDHDTLPARFFTEAGSSGIDFKVPPLNRKDFESARDNYYRIRGLDADGIPYSAKANQLGLEFDQ